MVGEEHLLSALNQEFINIVNKVGVDINECVAHPHTSNLVQFIGGLGPRKGASLLKTLRGMSNPRYVILRVSSTRNQGLYIRHYNSGVYINPFLMQFSILPSSFLLFFFRQRSCYFF